MPPFTHLSKSEIIEIRSLGHEIGSHGLTHADLTRLNTKDLSHELHDSKKMLEDIIDKKVTAISFPFGSWNKRVWDLAQEAKVIRSVLFAENTINCLMAFSRYTEYIILTRRETLFQESSLHFLFHLLYRELELSATLQKEHQYGNLIRDIYPNNKLNFD